MEQKFKDELAAVGTDLQGTIARFMNKEDLYEKFLKKFLDDKSFKDLKIRLENNEVEEAFKCAHTLKGVSANLGLESVHQVVAPLVEDLRNGDMSDVENKFNLLTEKYNEICEIIARN